MPSIVHVDRGCKSLALCSLLTYNRHGFNWFDKRGTEGVGFIRALRTLLTNNLPKILPDLTCIIRTRFEELHATHPVINGIVYLTCLYECS